MGEQRVMFSKPGWYVQADESDAHYGRNGGAGVPSVPACGQRTTVERPPGRGAHSALRGLQGGAKARDGVER